MQADGNVTYVRQAGVDQVVRRGAEPNPVLTVVIQGERQKSDNVEPSIADYAALSAFLWPIALAFVAWLFRREFSALLARVKEVSFKLLGQEVSMSAEKASDVLEEITKDMVSDLDADHWRTFEKIKLSNGSNTVNDIFPGFKRHTRDHEILGELRQRTLVRPLEGGSWQANKHPVLTRLAAVIARTKPDLFPVE